MIQQIKTELQRDMQTRLLVHEKPGTIHSVDVNGRFAGFGTVGEVFFDVGR